VVTKAKAIGSVEAVALTHRGKIRRGHEDAFILGQHVQPAPALYPIITEQILPLDGSIVAVIDGMGGLGGGDIAATWLAKRWAPRKVRTAKTLVTQLKKDHADLLDMARPTHTPMMGAVATGAALLPDHALLFHAGDTRAYLVNGTVCTQLTKDDLGEEGIVMQAFGGGKRLCKEAQIEPHTLKVEWRKDCALLLMSDGAWQYLRPTVISLAYAARPKLKDLVLALTEVVLDGRADDNLTIIAVRRARWDGMTP
jgi:serine/threonine protein phosphatase PrpC